MAPAFRKQKSAIDAEYDVLMDDLQAAIDDQDDSGLRADRIRVIRLRIEVLLREQMSRPTLPVGNPTLN